MREDMYKVIVERPRGGAGMDAKKARRFRNSEEVPHKIGIKDGYKSRKGLNENLAPLKRWLESQVNRPWAKVYAELCANIDRRNTVQEHIFAHIDNYVERNVHMIDGAVYFFERWGRDRGPKPIAGSDTLLFVHPVTGVLLKNRHRKTYSQHHREARAHEATKLAAKRRELSETVQLHFIEGIWYHVILATMALGRTVSDAVSGKMKQEYPKHWDAMRNQYVSRDPYEGDTSPTTEATFSRRYVYAVSKRQLSNADLKRYKLNNEAKQNAGDSRRFVFVFTIRAALIH